MEDHVFRAKMCSVDLTLENIYDIRRTSRERTLLLSRTAYKDFRMNGEGRVRMMAHYGDPTPDGKISVGSNGWRHYQYGFDANTLEPWSTDGVLSEIEVYEVEKVTDYIVGLFGGNMPKYQLFS